MSLDDLGTITRPFGVVTRDSAAEQEWSFNDLLQQAKLQSKQ
jgi:hypothetical protein